MGGFAMPDPNQFVSLTWALLPQHHLHLRRTALSSLDDLYVAVLDMHQYVSTTPKSSTRCEENPEDGELEAMFCENQEVCTTYLRVRAVELGVVAALATLTGGAADVSKLLLFFFWSDFHEADIDNDDAGPPFKRGSSLLDIEHQLASDCSDQVYRMLKMGRKTDESSLDRLGAPLAACIYGKIGDVQLQSTFEQRCVHPMNGLSSWELLLSLSFDVVQDVANEVGRMIPSRADLLKNIMLDLEERHFREKVWLANGK